jgi:hypothetical protein
MMKPLKRFSVYTFLINSQTLAGLTVLSADLPAQRVLPDVLGKMSTRLLLHPMYFEYSGLVFIKDTMYGLCMLNL